MGDRRTAILEATARVVARQGARGLRVEEVAREAGVSTGLIYYHFDDRAGLLEAAFAFANDRAGQYTAPATGAAPRSAYEDLEGKLLLELQDDPRVIENSALWGELRASAIFDATLREPLRRANEAWVAEVVAFVERAQAEDPSPPRSEPETVAQRLVALTEGLSDRWLSGLLTLEAARGLLRGAIAQEVGRPDRRLPRGSGGAVD